MCPVSRALCPVCRPVSRVPCPMFPCPVSRVLCPVSRVPSRVPSRDPSRPVYQRDVQ